MDQRWRLNGKNKTPIHLVAGEYSKEGWDVPNNVRKATIQFYTQPRVGHIMMLENPDEFCEIIKLRINLLARITGLPPDCGADATISKFGAQRESILNSSLSALKSRNK